AGVFYKTSSLFSKISTSGGSIFGGLFKNKDDLEGMSEGRINVILLGMRGQNIPGGSLLADSIMVVSVKPGENKVAMISIPRDLYVEIPGKNYSRKINEVNPIGEEEGKGKGLELMKEVVGNVTGLPIHYAISANFDALRDTVDVIGGITVHLDKPFYEGKQFVEGNECGGEFSLPEGEVDLSGEKALCYSRARFATSDFDRARRQQEVLLAIKEKALSAGTLSDFGKVNDLLNVMGDNIRTDMKPWEMQKLFEVTNEVDDPKVYRKVFDTSEQGLLKAANNGSYILLPADEDFGRIKEECKNIFNDSNTAKK
ncbi:LCP family protein, partial [Patescibacteria group bacterium]|nr:LCP family protein [Patescibacteria group bacterium]